MKKNTVLIFAAILAIIGIIYSITAFDKAFPIVNVQITADRHDILYKADSLTQEFALIDSSHRSVVGFNTDEHFKNFVELEGGGVEAFQEIVDAGMYYPYTWSVRQFNINEIHELEYIFSPDGMFLGFNRVLPDSLPGKDIPDFDIQRDLVLSEGMALLFPDIRQYTLIEKSSELKEGGRRDHIFTYERDDAGVGDARYRLKLEISGDKLTMIWPGVKIPEAFDRRYEEMRSANSTISFTGQAIMIILYGFIGIGAALFFMLRRKTLLWQPPLKWAITIGIIVFLAYLTTMSLSWFNYDTSLSVNQFIFQQVMMALLNGLLIGVIFFISALAAEGLDRQAFPQHIQFWKSWSPTVGASREVMRHTIFGYLWAFFMIGFVTFFYWITNNVFNWWSPAENMVDPNVLALPLPWLLPAANSLQAGFWEECLFRAIPLAGAVVIGKNFKRKGLWIGIALVLQAAIFGSLHANYAQQPAYARIVEMLIPFVLYGLIYINWGLLPVIISHFVYDIVLMAMPLFILSAPGIWVHRIFAILAALIPLLIIGFLRLRAGTWYDIQAKDYNAGYKAPKTAKKEEKKESPDTIKHDHKSFPVFFAIIITIIGSALWVLLTPFEQDIPKLKIDKHKALMIADAFMEQHYAANDSVELKPYIRVKTGFNQDSRFIWEYSDKQIFKDLYVTTLASNHFIVAYKTFEGDIETRAETVTVHVGHDGNILSWSHHVPEDRPGTVLSESEARAIAEAEIEKHFGISIDALESVQVKPEKLKARTDWQFIYRDMNTGLKEGDIRYIVTLAGDKISGMNTDVHAPESWEREQKKKSIQKTILKVISIVIKSGMLITMVIMGIIAWTRKQFNFKIFLLFFIGFFIFSLIETGLMTNAQFGQFPTSEPWGNLVLVFILVLILGSIFSGFMYGISMGYLARLPLPIHRNEDIIWFKGISLGLLLAGVTAFAEGGMLKSVPNAISLGDVDSLMPILSSIVNGIENYFILLIRLMAPFVIVNRLTNAWNKNKVAALIILFLSGFMIVGDLSIGWWLLGGSVAGLTMIGLYMFILRYNMIYIPIMLATGIILNAVQYFIVDPVIYSGIHAIITIVITLIAVFFAVWKMHRLRLLQPK